MHFGRGTPPAPSLGVVSAARANRLCNGLCLQTNFAACANKAASVGTRGVIGDSFRVTGDHWGVTADRWALSSIDGGCGGQMETAGNRWKVPGQMEGPGERWKAPATNGSDRRQPTADKAEATRHASGTKCEKTGDGLCNAPAKSRHGWRATRRRHGLEPKSRSGKIARHGDLARRANGKSQAPRTA